MKRSEMVRMLCAIINLNTHKTIDEFSGDYLCTLEEASIVLKKLENLGMLPPDQNKDVEPPCAVLTYWEEE